MDFSLFRRSRNADDVQTDAGASGARVSLGAPNGDQNASPNPNPAIHSAREAARDGLRKSARRTGSRQDAGASGVDRGAGASGAASAALADEIARQLEQCYDPKAWGALLAAPGDVMAVVADRPEKWRLSKDERDTLGSCGSAFARTLMISNPRTLAALMLASGLFAVYVPRALDELNYRASKKKGAPSAPADKAAT